MSNKSAEQEYTITTPSRMFRGRGAMGLVFDSGVCVTNNQPAASYCKSLGYTVTPDPDATSETPHEQTEKKSKRLLWCICDENGVILESFIEENDAYVFVWSDATTSIIGFCSKKDAQKFIANVGLENCVAIRIPDTYTAHEAPVGMEADG